MSGLKALKTRIRSVETTNKITNAMRMIAVSNLRKTHSLLLEAYPYLQESTRMLRRLVRSLSFRGADLPLLIRGKDSKKKHVVICVSSNQGLCGHFNQNVVAKTQQVIDYLLAQDSSGVQLVCFGSRGAEILKKKNPTLPIHVIQEQSKERDYLFLDAQNLAHSLINAFYKNDFDVCTIIYSLFQNAAIQKIQIDQLLPLQTFQHENKWQFLMNKQEADYMNEDVLGNKKLKRANAKLFSVIGQKNFTSLWGKAEAEAIAQELTRLPTSYDYNPTDAQILDTILIPFVEAHVYQILLNSITSENAARMLAMENASRNASEMIKTLHKKYHRKRQEIITNDLNVAKTDVVGS